MKYVSELAKRMKAYENVSKEWLTKKTPVIMRFDGVSFKTFTRGFNKPFDEILSKCMQETMLCLCKNIQGCKLGYTQSDEISLLLVDYDTADTCAWFDYEVEKMTSVAAGWAAVAFNEALRSEKVEFAMALDRELEQLMKEGLAKQDAREKLKDKYKYLDMLKTKGGLNKPAAFDARVFNLPKEEVNNCFIWRQQDASSNSIQSLAQSMFSAKELFNKNTNKMQDMIFTKSGINWNNLPVIQKRGCCAIKTPVTVNGVTRNKWKIDYNIPIFTQDTTYVESRGLITR